VEAIARQQPSNSYCRRCGGLLNQFVKSRGAIAHDLPRERAASSDVQLVLDVESGGAPRYENPTRAIDAIHALRYRSKPSGWRSVVLFISFVSQPWRSWCWPYRRNRQIERLQIAMARSISLHCNFGSDCCCHSEFLARRSVLTAETTIYVAAALFAWGPCGSYCVFAIGDAIPRSTSIHLKAC